MSIAIIDLEFGALPAVLTGLAAYAEACVLVRVGGQPAAWVRAPVEDGCLHRQTIVDALHQQAHGYFWRMVAQSRLPQIAQAEGQPKPDKLPTATVAICTRDRAEDLVRCLTVLCTLPEEGQEIIVVDSASRTEATAQVVSTFPEVRYVRLERPGLNIARNAAIQHANGDIVVFIDDDAIPDHNWLQAHRQAFEHPFTLASMGLTLPLELDSPAQEQFEAFSTFNRGFAPRVFHRSNTHPMAAGQAGAGVNMAIRRQAATLVGIFNEALDAGTPTHSGGESEFLSRVIAGGYQIVYTPTALNWHRHRRSMAELRRTIYGYGVGVYAFWTCRLLEGRETAAFGIAAQWFWSDQLPRLLRSFARRPDSAPWPLPWDELRGCWAGPVAYLRARRQAAQVNR